VSIAASGASIASPNPELRELLFADLDLGAATQRYAEFESMRALAAAIARGEPLAVRDRLAGVVAATPDTRIRLQALRMARTVRNGAPPDISRAVRGVVIDMAVGDGLDTLAGFDDGTARYFNHAGRVIAWDAPDPEIDGLVRDLLVAGQRVADVTGPLDGPRPSPPGRDGAAIWLLTERGTHVGMGPAASLMADSLGGPVIAAGIRLMQALIRRSTGTAPFSR
jgi:hypothetical protein